MSKQKSFGETKATIHTPLKEKDLYYLDLLAEEQNKRRAEIIEEALYNLPAFKEIQKKYSLFDI